MDINEFITKIIDTNGFYHQTYVAIEEMSELQKEICKYLRGNGNLENIREEMADVKLCLMELQEIFLVTDYQIGLLIEKKIERTAERELNNGGTFL